MFKMLTSKIKKPQHNKEDISMGLYTIVAPAVIHSDYAYNVAITQHDENKPLTLDVGISGPSYRESQIITVQPCSSEIVHFDLPPLQKGNYELCIEGQNGVAINCQSTLIFDSKLPKIYIQMDKATYKPEDLVQFRILALDENLKPSKIDESLSLAIQDGASNNIKQIKDIQLINGVYTGKFQLSEQPNLGEWQMELRSEGEEKPRALKTFDVEKYVLPKFSVELEAVKKIAIPERTFKVTVCSKYTYGKPVRGTATLRASFKRRNTECSEKTIDIDGRGEVEFNMFDDLKIDQYQGYELPAIQVEAIVSETLSGVEQNAKVNIDVERSRYSIKVPKLLKSYEVNESFEITAIVSRLDGSPVKDSKATAKLLLHQNRADESSCDTDEQNEFIFESKVDKNGVAVFKIKFTSEIHFRSVQIKYEEKILKLPEIRIRAKNEDKTQSMDEDKQCNYKGSFKLFPISTNPELDEDIIINVLFKHPIPYFVYTVMVRGKIVRHEYVKIQGNKNYGRIKMEPSFELFPAAKFFVYFIKDGELISDETTINVPHKFQNMLEITSVDQAKPSDIVTLNIKTEPNSFVGLMAVDQSVLLLKSGNDLDVKEILNGLKSYDSRSENSFFHNSMPGMKSGFKTITNAKNLYIPIYRCYNLCRMNRPAEDSLIFYACSSNFKSLMPEAQIRKNFVESWIFDNIESTDSEGIAKFSKQIPDTITSWVITGFSLNDRNGFGITECPTKIQVFQPFFLSTNLPYSIKRGESIAIPILVFNYMETQMDAEIIMDNSQGEYEFTEESTDTNCDKMQRVKKISIPSNNSQSVTFSICPKIIGDITLKIKAITPLAGDAIHQKLKVEPEGITQHENEAFFFSIASGETVNYSVKANIPTDAVLDSEYLEFSAMGDILAPTIKNIHQLVRMPYGCGEQNMVNFVPNILVLHYLAVIKAHLPEVAEQAKAYMEKGYQRELTYKHANGAYSAFGEGADEANSWLTAYVARSFIQARKYITISEEIITEALNYLVSTQKDNGQFPQTGTLFYSSNQSEVGISAFIMLALLEDQDFSLKYKTEIAAGLEYLSVHLENEDDIYTLALVGLVFQIVQHPKLKSVVEKIELQAIDEKNLKWWSKTSNSNDIEITAYILQTLVESRKPSEVLPIVKWLIGQRNNLGGFGSTQDTVVGLQALIKFAEKYAIGGSNKVIVSYEAQNLDGVETAKGTFEVDKENALLLQSHVLPKTSRQLTLTASGEGSSLVQLSYRYNIVTKEIKPSFLIKHTLKPNLYPGQLQQNICSEYKPMNSTDGQKSNMAVMEIYLPSGYATDNDSLSSIRDIEQIQRVEMKNNNTGIVVYFECLTVGHPIAFDVASEKTHEVADLKPAVIFIYDYYNAEQRATIYYELN